MLVWSMNQKVYPTRSCTSRFSLWEQDGGNRREIDSITSATGGGGPSWSARSHINRVTDPRPVVLKRRLRAPARRWRNEDKRRMLRINKPALNTEVACMPSLEVYRIGRQAVYNAEQLKRSGREITLKGASLSLIVVDPVSRCFGDRWLLGTGGPRKKECFILVIDASSRSVGCSRNLARSSPSSYPSPRDALLPFLSHILATPYLL